MSSVASRRELYERLHLDASISGSYGLFSASGSMTLDEEFDFTENELVWILKATSDYGNYAVKSIDLTAQATGFASDPGVFFDRCGTHVVTQHRRDCRCCGSILRT